MIHHKVSGQLGMPGIHDECKRIASLPDGDEYCIDVSAIQHFEPIAMLLLGSALRKLSSRNGDARQLLIVGRDDGIQGHSYASRMGFWWSIGAEGERPEPSRNASGATIPIARLDYDDLFRKAGGADPIRGGLVSDAAAKSATALCGCADDTPLWNALEYAFREMFRNAFEHSQAGTVWYTASTRPSKDDVQLAILDEGCGIRASLENSGKYSFRNDAEAIECALRPGVSRNEGRSRTPEQEARLRDEFPGQDPAEWDNSGYGLTLVSELCRQAGQYTIVSGHASLSYLYARISSYACHEGTALRFVFQPSRLEKALQSVGLAGKPRRGGKSSQSLMSASQRLRYRNSGG